MKYGPFIAVALLGVAGIAALLVGNRLERAEPWQEEAARGAVLGEMPDAEVAGEWHVALRGERTVLCGEAMRQGARTPLEVHIERVSEAENAVSVHAGRSALCR